MADDRFKPPSAAFTLAASRWRSTPIAAVVGVVAALLFYVGFVLVLQALFAIDVAAENADLELNVRLRATGHYASISAFSYAIGAGVGGWSAARFGRRSWALAALTVAGVLFALVLAAAYLRFGTIPATQFVVLSPMFPASLVGAYCGRAV